MKQKSVKDTKRKGGTSRKLFRASMACILLGREHAQSSVLSVLADLVSQLQEPN